MYIIAFLFCFVAGFWNFILSILRLLFSTGAEVYYRDGHTKRRKKKYRKALRAFLWAIVFFILTAHFAAAGLGL